MRELQRLRRVLAGSALGSGPPRRPSPEGRHQIALLASLVLHGAVLLAGLWQWNRAPYGSPGPDLGTGMAVTLVDGFAGGGARPGDAGSEAERPLRIDRATPPTPRPPDKTEAVLPTPPPEPEAAPVARGEAAPTLRAAMALARLEGAAANPFDGLSSAADATGGDPLADSDLAARIAACLPPGFRARLAFAQLTLSVGVDGRLMAPPEVRASPPMLSPADRAAADRIVQAAMLCGPYSHPDLLGRSVSLPLDFEARSPAALPRQR